MRHMAPHRGASAGGLLRTTLTRDDGVAELAARWLDRDDLRAIRRRVIGGGLVGGKAAGMLVARAIVERSEPRFLERLEPHDSWFIGSDVFDAFLVRNGCPRPLRHRGLLDGTAETRARILGGAFDDREVARLRAMLGHYGERPIVVRSSSVLEDGSGGAFPGKYESVFCANQGPPDERLAALLDAIRRVYASAVGDEALWYRERRGLLERDDPMAVLVQRVSGAAHGSLFFPHVAGVALSHNPWAWSEEIDPRAGMVRLVFGLGTRAVARADDDHTRLVALNAPARRPETTAEEVAERSQRRVDVIDLARGRADTRPFEEIATACPGLPLDLFATGRAGGRPVLTFDKLLAATPFVEDVRAMLRVLAGAYGQPVDVELTANFPGGGGLQLNLLQCRRFQTRAGGVAARPPIEPPDEAVVLASRGPVVGPSTSAPLDRVVFVDPDAYDRLAADERHEVARAVGRVTRLDRAARLRILLLGPGRWGTSTTSLGVPTSPAEIQGVCVIGEIVKASMRAVPDVSLGSHFFGDLVESSMLYVAVYPGRPGYRLAEDLLRAAPNRLPQLLPADARLEGVIRVVDFPLRGDDRALWVDADCVRQEAVCHLVPPPAQRRLLAR